MKLIVYNGSPRGKNSNTRLLMDAFISGMKSVGGYDVETYFLAAKSQREEGAGAMRTADCIILAFPLYTDSMPGIVKEFIELLNEYQGMDGNPRIGFLVQSGFPEPAHSRHVEKYLERLTLKLKAEYIGTIVKGGVEGIQIMPGWMTKKLYGRLFKMGVHFAGTGEYDKKLLKKLVPYEKFSRRTVLMYQLMKKTGFTNLYWDQQLKKNGVFEQRFARPLV